MIARAALVCLVGLLGVGAKKVGVKEVVFDSPVKDIQWAGKDFGTVFVQSTKGRLYMSNLELSSPWQDITDDLRVRAASTAATFDEGTVIDSVSVSPADPKVVLVAGTQKTHFLTENAGLTWRRLRHKATIHSVVFHATRAKWALVSTWTEACSGQKTDSSPCQHMLYITKDLGRTFQLVTSYVVQFNWGDVTHEQQDRIYFSRFRQMTGPQPKLTLWSKDVDFCFSDTGGRKVETVVGHGNKFLISNGYIFVAKLKDELWQTVTLEVSADGAKTFRPSQLNVDLNEKSYNILDTSEGAVILHVNHGERKGGDHVGSVYISDKSGSRYSLSLPNNIRSTTGDCEFDKVLNLEGVYIANFKEVASEDSRAAEAAAEAEEVESEGFSKAGVDQKHGVQSKGKDEDAIKTVITFDKGGVWSYLKAPKVDSVGAPINCPKNKCWLHLHGVTNFRNYAPFYSTETAVGIIMGTGNVGESLRFEEDQVNTYISRDGGLTWFEAHKGAFVYEIGDHGGLLVMADDVQRTKQVVFSWDEGASWYDFDMTGESLEVDNIVTGPNSTSTSFLLYGTRDSAAVMYHLDFEPLHQKTCTGVFGPDSVSSDYETWTPTDGRTTEHCLLGREITYVRRKQTSECFNGEKFDRPISRKNCVCTEEDYECELGFARQVGSLVCRPVEGANFEGCMGGVAYVDAYRKVAGDTCESGWYPQKVAAPCSDGKISKSGLAVLLGALVVAILMGSVTLLMRSERFKHLFQQAGFETFSNVKYDVVGKLGVESAMETMGERYEDKAEFMGQAESDEDEPPVVLYQGQDDDDDEEREVAKSKSLQAATKAVPKLSGPPGQSSKVDDLL